MNQVQITLKSGKEFSKHEPGKLEYYMAYANKTDFLVYEAGFYDPLDLQPDDEITFSISPSIGDPIKFVGVLYSKKIIGRVNQIRMTFVSKYFQKLCSAEPLFGKGKTSEIAGTFYLKSGVPSITKDESDVSVDSIIFPRTTHIDDAVSYLLGRSTAPGNSYLVGTIIGDSAYIRDVKKGINDIRGAGAEGDGGLYYQVMNVKDDRRRVDIVGGIKTTMYSDSGNVDIQSFSSDGLNLVKTQKFYGITDKLLAKAAIRVRQLQTYYGGYTAVLSTIGALPLIGSNLIVNNQDITSSQAWFKSLDRGKYFINSQVIEIDFKNSYPKTMFGVMLVDDQVTG